MKLACQKLLMVDIQSTHFTMTSAGCAKNAEETVRNVVNGMIDADPTICPRPSSACSSMCCFVMGRDASILLDPTAANGQPEKATTLLRPAADPSLDPAYAAQLNATCPPSYQAVNNSPVAPNTLSNQYYRNAGCCILTSDAALLTRSERHGGEGEHERVGRLDVVVVDGAVQGRGW
ncbi:hypothetical protein HU200_021344 [Digitaria exilis]|uniref:Uncharacterized protein n=1 Tax=Digitaria exilis TaxID=1010633 RepID=A0A835KCZ3_9POAL|nr:hypothetical protein HU200_021344 [Digitaria exilis]